MPLSKLLRVPRAQWVSRSKASLLKNKFDEMTDPELLAAYRGAAGLEHLRGELGERVIAALRTEQDQKGDADARMLGLEDSTIIEGTE